LFEYAKDERSEQRLAKNDHESSYLGIIILKKIINTLASLQDQNKISAAFVPSAFKYLADDRHPAFGATWILTLKKAVPGLSRCHSNIALIPYAVKEKNQRHAFVYALSLRLIIMR
jgi:hypothetical protein